MVPFAFYKKKHKSQTHKRTKKQKNKKTKNFYSATLYAIINIIFKHTKILWIGKVSYNEYYREDPSGEKDSYEL